MVLLLLAPCPFYGNCRYKKKFLFGIGAILPFLYISTASWIFAKIEKFFTLVDFR
jgi:hypothetical protein